MKCIINLNAKYKKNFISPIDRKKNLEYNDITKKMYCNMTIETDEKSKQEIFDIFKYNQNENSRKVNEDLLLKEQNEIKKNSYTDNSFDCYNKKSCFNKKQTYSKKKSNVRFSKEFDGEEKCDYTDTTDLKNKENINENNNSENTESDNCSVNSNEDLIDDEDDVFSAPKNKLNNNIPNSNKNVCDPLNFNNLIMKRINEYKQEMNDFLENSRNEVDELYDNLFKKTEEISSRKAKRISQLHMKDFPFSHSYSDNVNDSKNINILKEEIMVLKNSVSQPFNKFEVDKKIIIINERKESKIDLDSAIKNSEIPSFVNKTSFPNISEKIKIREKTNQKNIIKESNEDDNNTSINDNYCHDINKNINIIDENRKNLFFGYEEKEITKIKHFANKNLIEKLNTMFELHENLKLSIIQNFQLMKNFLIEYDLNNNNPLQEFIDTNAKDICESWFLPKINFKNLNMTNFIKNKEIPDTFKNFIINEESKNKFTSYTIEKTKNSKNYELERKILKNNFSFLNKLDLVSLDSKEDLKKVFYEEQINKLNFERIQKINFRFCKLDNINYLYFFPNLSKLQFKICRFAEMPSHFSINFNMVKNIIFKNCNLNNDNIVYLMNEFQQLKYLESIDFSLNNITVFDFKPNNQFKNLQSLILRKNKISKINIFNKEFLKRFYPKLEIVNVVSNNICNIDENDFANILDPNRGIKLIVLLGKNLFLNNKIIVLKKYLKYLFKYLSISTVNLIYLDLSHLLYKLKSEEKFNMKNIKLNLNIQISIRKLDLSYNSLHDADLFNLFKENQGMVNLTDIILKNNNFTKNVLNLFIKINSQNLFEYLKTINFNGNKLDITSLEIIIKIIDDNKNLSKINILNNHPLKEEIELVYDEKSIPEDKILIKEFNIHIEKILKKQKGKIQIIY